jgi:hypothetical protein
MIIRISYHSVSYELLNEAPVPWRYAASAILTTALNQLLKMNILIQAMVAECVRCSREV